MVVPPNHPNLDHFSIESHGDLGIPSFKTHPYPIGSMVLLYMVTWIPSIYPLYVSIYTSTMDPSWVLLFQPLNPPFNPPLNPRRLGTPVGAAMRSG